MYKKMLVAVDGSDASNQGLDEAIKLAKALGSKLKIIHVLNDVFLVGADQPYLNYEAVLESFRASGEKTIAAASARARERQVDFESELIDAQGQRASEAIVRHAQEWGADLLVLGTHGRRGLRRVALGSDAEAVARSSTIPVLLVRTKEKAA
jgi:nucleotide-binding universal stress UspA family protein